MTEEDVQAMKELRLRAKAEFGRIYDDVAAILFRHDPVGINFETNEDEYEPEVGTILPRLGDCQSESDVQHVVHEEFVRWFSDRTAGPQERYSAIAADVWTLWQQIKGISAEADIRGPAM